MSEHGIFRIISGLLPPIRNRLATGSLNAVTESLVGGVRYEGMDPGGDVSAFLG
jgi:hypothetical protein